MLGPSRRLGSLLGTSRAAAAALDAVLSKPIAEQGARPLSSSTSAAAADHQTADEAWCHEVQGAEGGGGGDGGDRRQRGRQGSRRLDAPIDAPRTLRDYQNIVVALSRRKRCALLLCCGAAGMRRGWPACRHCGAALMPACKHAHIALASNRLKTGCHRAYLIRDVLDEMSLNGVRPDRFILTTGVWVAMCMCGEVFVPLCSVCWCVCGVCSVGIVPTCLLLRGCLLPLPDHPCTSHPPTHAPWNCRPVCVHEESQAGGCAALL